MSLPLTNHPQNFISAEHFEFHEQMPPDLVVRLEHLAYTCGKTYDSYLITEDNRQYFWSPNRKGALGFIRDKKYCHVIGGLMAKEEDKDELLEHFMKFTHQQGMKVTSFFNIPEEDLAVFRKQGFQISKVGEEPLIDLHQTNWQGKDYEWIRRQENYCKRQGLRFEEVIPSPQDKHYRETIGPEIEEISTRHIHEQTTHGEELKYFEGRFQILAMGRRRVFIARSNFRIEGFLVCNPAQHGMMWAVEIYRKRQDAPRGVVPYMMLQTMRQLKDEGVPHMSLSIAPCLRCEEKYPGDSPLVRLGNVLWFNHLNFLFDMHGIYHFKSRFRPEFRPLFLAAYPKATYASMDSFLNAWGVGSINPIRLFKSVMKKIRKLRVRQNLASQITPEATDSSFTN